MASKKTDLTAPNLKSLLWQTLQDTKSGKVTAGQADAVAAQAREILRTVKTQLAIFTQSGKAVSSELIEFAKPSE